eukprot:TRINITY_DN4268_c0_g1_i2.p2 TRINITY_DN4268_c0_g1~~TRINITY_DN4268_c0_g1_i2.p2  ORF type:complete len:130 (+),score=65.98 TRINITY_DN4268_c0_g1_i2:181-570(+)
MFDELAEKARLKQQELESKKALMNEAKSANSADLLKDIKETVNKQKTEKGIEATKNYVTTSGLLDEVAQRAQSVQREKEEKEAEKEKRQASNLFDELVHKATETAKAKEDKAVPKDKVNASLLLSLIHI